MADSINNNAVFQLTGVLSQSGTSVTVSADINNGGVVSLTNADILLSNQNGTKFERVMANISAGTMTIVSRGITKSQVFATDTNLQYEWRPGTICTVTLFASSTFDAAGDNTLTGINTFAGKILFSGATNSGLTVNNLTTTQRDALVSPTNGTIIYNTTAGEFQIRQGGAWVTMGSGSTQPNASPTVAGKVEIGTQTEVDAGTDTGGTGAILSVIPSTFNQGITNKIASQATAEAGTDNTKIMTPLSTKQAITKSVKFGGTGADGALAISSGTTNIDLGGLAFFETNYTSISITGTGALTFTNPNANGTTISLKSQGNVTITSSATRAIDLRGLGAQGGSGGAGGGNAGIIGSTDTEAFSTGHGGGGAPGLASNAGGSAGTVFSNSNIYSSTASRLKLRRYIWFSTGSGGGGGASATQAGGTAAGGAGGRGGGGLIIECNGSYNVTGTLDASGNVGSVGAIQGGNPSSGGGGGGSAGFILAMYNTLTTDSGTYTVAGGVGGIGGQGTGTNREAAGGGGGGGYIGGPGIVGGNGSGAGTGNSIGGNGGAGAAGIQIRTVNSIFN